MTNASSGVEIFDVRRIRFVEKAWHPISEPDRLTMERAWSEAVQENPNLFDGPTVACMNVEWKEPGSMVLSWARAAYRYRMLRQISGAPSVSSVFVCVAQPTEDGHLLVARMSSSTSTPGRWQLPGGSMEPPLRGECLDVAPLRRHAARELMEELGIDTLPESLSLWVVTRGARGSVGFVFRAPALPAEFLHQRFSALVSSEREQGRDSELDRIALIESEAELSCLAGEQVDYLQPIVRRNFEFSASSGSA
ncbi:NUDIX hydrolase [Streptomyces sp. NPDC090085]|uniref:NUDIX hydrolase n=1 Tax=Streptomyces sp. NPDC090085 TaxID=3365943 RepID=UPI0038280021